MLEQKEWYLNITSKFVARITRMKSETFLRSGTVRLLIKFETTKFLYKHRFKTMSNIIKKGVLLRRYALKDSVNCNILQHSILMRSLSLTESLLGKNYKLY